VKRGALDACAIDVLYEDADIAVIDKPPCLYVHPAPGHETGTLTDALLARFPQMRGIGSETRPGVVHRLDFGTSGVMVFALNRRAYTALREAFESHVHVEKTYLAVLHGAPKPPHGTLVATVGRKPWDPKRMALNVKDGKRAVTHWQLLSKKGPLALVEFKIETGRTHQIRLAAAHLGCPVVGDSLYGDKAADGRLRVKPRHLLLHAVTLAFKHPVTGKKLVFSAPPPPDFVHCL